MLIDQSQAGGFCLLILEGSWLLLIRLVGAEPLTTGVFLWELTAEESGHITPIRL